MRPKDLLNQREHPTAILDLVLHFYSSLKDYDPNLSLPVSEAHEVFESDRVRDLLNWELIEGIYSKADIKKDHPFGYRLSPLGIALLGPFAHPRIINHCTEYIEDFVQGFRDDIVSMQEEIDSGAEQDPEHARSLMLQSDDDAEDIEQIGVLIRDGQPQEAVKVYKKLDTGVREGIDDDLLLQLLLWFDPEQEEHERRDREHCQHLQDLVNQHGLNPLYTEPQ